MSVEVIDERPSEFAQKRTSAGIPVSRHPLFQEYLLEDLGPERSAFTVVERALAWGDVPELDRLLD